MSTHQFDTQDSVVIEALFSRQIFLPTVAAVLKKDPKQCTYLALHSVQGITEDCSTDRGLLYAISGGYSCTFISGINKLALMQAEWDCKEGTLLPCLIPLPKGVPRSASVYDRFGYEEPHIVEKELKQLCAWATSEPTSHERLAAATQALLHPMLNFIVRTSERNDGWSITVYMTGRRGESLCEMKRFIDYPEINQLMRDSQTLLPAMDAITRIHKL